MNTTLIVFVVLYLLGTLALGVWAGTRIKNSTDFAIAGRSLPLIMVITTTFATWFGAETVMGIPAKFVQGGLNAVVEDPFGAGMCLVLVGVFFAARLYRLNLLTIGDFYRQRYGQGIEVFCSGAIILSYLGWVAAQITALGLVFSVLTNGAMSETAGMVVGTLAVLIYVVVGGFLAVAWTDFIQMIVLVVGMSIIAVFAADLAGGAGVVFDKIGSQDLWRFLPEPGFKDLVFFIGAGITMMLGSIPQQDVFQRGVDLGGAGGIQAFTGGALEHQQPVAHRHVAHQAGVDGLGLAPAGRQGTAGPGGRHAQGQADAHGLTHEARVAHAAGGIGGRAAGLVGGDVEHRCRHGLVVGRHHQRAREGRRLWAFKWPVRRDRW